MEKYTFSKRARPASHLQWRRTALKILSTLGIAAATALAAKLRTGSESWQETLERLSTLQLFGVLLLLPFAAIVVQFLEAFFFELNVLAKDGGKGAAQLFAKIPTALANASRRLWRACAVLWTRWHFARTYKQRLYEDYGLFNDRGLGLINAARLDLERVYVDLQISNQVVEARSDLLRDPAKGRQPIWHFLSGIKPGRGLVLLGAPGSGKTTLLQYLLLVFASHRHRRNGQQKYLPILVELRLIKLSVGKEGSTTLASAIRDYWQRNTRIADLMRSEPGGWLEHQLHSRKVLVLLDGLDEVPLATRADVSRWVSSQIQQYRNCKFLITSRPGGYTNAPLSNAAVLEVQPFSRDQINQFIDGWYLANEIVASGKGRAEAPIRRRATDEANDLRRRLRDNSNLQDLTVNPLLLTMVCMVHRYHGALPGSRSQLYGEICQVLLERWRQAKDIHDELNGEQKLSVLRPLAHEYMVREKRELSEAEAVSVIDEQLVFIGYKKDGDAAAGGRFLRSIQFGSGLLLEKEAGVWSFAHKTFQEYLTSEYWLRGVKASPDWTACVAQDWWREALLLYAARGDASEIVEAAISLNEAASWALGFQCLSEAHSMRPDVRKRAEEKLRQALHSIQVEVFMPAARSMHYLRQLQVRRISEDAEQRATLVTNAEYQLFLDELSRDERAVMVPPHWSEGRFVGDPESPVVGVWPWQAEAYAATASRGAFSATWRLPSVTEKIVQAEENFVYWCQGAQLSNGAATEEWDEQTSLSLLPEGLSRDDHVDLRTAHELAAAIGSALWIGENQNVDVPLALATSLNVAIAYAFSLDTGRAHELARIASFDEAIARRLLEALKNASSQDIRELRIDTSTAKLGTVRKRRAAANTPSRAGRRAQVQPQAVDCAATEANRKQLLFALGQILSDSNRWSASSQGWRNYASFLLTMSIPHLANAQLDIVVRLERAMRITSGRQMGRLLAREGIYLVRDMH